jgi:hypothetical protein
MRINAPIPLENHEPEGPRRCAMPPRAHLPRRSRYIAIPVSSEVLPAPCLPGPSPWRAPPVGHGQHGQQRHLTGRPARATVTLGR